VFNASAKNGDTSGDGSGGSGGGDTGGGGGKQQGAALGAGAERERLGRWVTRARRRRRRGLREEAYVHLGAGALEPSLRAVALIP